MVSSILLLTVVVFFAQVVCSALAYDARSLICQRFPSNVNCRSSAPIAAQPPPMLANDQSPPFQSALVQTPVVRQTQDFQVPPPVPVQAQDLAMPQQQFQPIPSQAQAIGGPCDRMKTSFDNYCFGSNLAMEDQMYCDEYRVSCLGVQPVNSRNYYERKLKTQQFGNGWTFLTQRAYQTEQTKTFGMTDDWLRECGNYNQHYNALCYPHVEGFYCELLRRMCLSRAEDLAAGKTLVVGPFANNHGLPTGGSGSSRPLTVGSNIGIGPFFNLGDNVGVNPLQGVGHATQLQVPFVGLQADISKSVDFGGLIGLAQVGQLLDGRRRRRSAPSLIYRYYIN